MVAKFHDTRTLTHQDSRATSALQGSWLIRRKSDSQTAGDQPAALQCDGLRAWRRRFYKSTLTEFVTGGAC